MSYQPDSFNDSSLLGRYVATEFRKLADNLKNLEVDSIRMKVWYITPDKPREAQMYYFDATNPSATTSGFYSYTGGAWLKL